MNRPLAINLTLIILLSLCAANANAMHCRKLWQSGKRYRSLSAPLHQRLVHTQRTNLVPNSSSSLAFGTTFSSSSKQTDAHISVFAKDEADNGFFRFDENTDDEHLAVKTYAMGDVYVHLLATQHAAEKSFYDRINEIIQGKTVIYESIEMSYEDVNRQKQAVRELPENYQKISSYLDNLQSNLFARALSLAIQTNEIDYLRAIEAIHGDFPMPDMEKPVFEKRINDCSFHKEMLYSSALHKFRLDVPNISLRRIFDEDKLISVLVWITIQRLQMESEYKKHFGSYELGPITIDERIRIEVDAEKGSLMISASDDCPTSILRDQIIHSTRQVIELGLNYKTMMYRMSYDFKKDRVLLRDRIAQHALKPCADIKCPECQLIHPRNNIACQRLDELLRREQTPKEIVLLYGMNHAFGLEAFLLEKGFQLRKTEWIKSISGKNHRATRL